MKGSLSIDSSSAVITRKEEEQDQGQDQDLQQPEQQDGRMTPRTNNEESVPMNRHISGDSVYSDDDDDVGGATNHRNYYYSVGQVATMEAPVEDERGNTSSLRRKSFIVEFVKSDGPPQIVLLVLLIALGFGSTIGVVPAVMTDRYARLNHGYDGSKGCSEYSSSSSSSSTNTNTNSTAAVDDVQDAIGTVVDDYVKPEECLLGSADAQMAVSVEQLISHLISFFTSSYIGSISDEYGRRNVLIVGVFMSCFPPLALVLMQIYHTMSPNWYYITGAMTGIINWISIALSALSDVMPSQWRAPSFGLLLAGFSLGFSMAPILAILMGHFRVSIMSLIMIILGFINVLFFFPETLDPTKAAHARLVREEQMSTMNNTAQQRILWNIYRPIWELSILNRNRLFRLLSCLAFFSGIVSSGDRTLMIYYVQERFTFTDRDIAKMFFIMGLLGIFVQGVLLKLFNDCIGERKVVILSFSLACVHSILYGVAQNKATIFIAVAIGSISFLAFPTISAIKSNNVAESEQGRIQGALYSLSALASALGPMLYRTVYQFTNDNHDNNPIASLFGSGTMFLFGACIYLLAVYFAYLLPNEANSKEADGSTVTPTPTPDDASAGSRSPLV